MTERQSARLRIGDSVKAIDGKRGKIIYRDVAVIEILWADESKTLQAHWQAPESGINSAPEEG